LNLTESALVFSTYLGGSADTRAAGIRVDSWGNMYVAGSTAATDFPTTANAIQTHNAGGFDVFVTAYNTGGSGYMYSTYLGGSSDDFGYAIAGDWSTGNVFVTGEVDSSNFPTVKPAQASLKQAPDSPSGGAPGGFNAFVFEIQPQSPPPTIGTGGSGSGGTGTGGHTIIDTHTP
jgi:hypothetical protein